MDNYQIAYEDMPPMIKAFTVRENGNYIIVLNSRLTKEQNEKSYLHEVHHIENGDFEKSYGVGWIELFSHH